LQGLFWDFLGLILSYLYIYHYCNTAHEELKPSIKL